MNRAITASLAISGMKKTENSLLANKKYYLQIRNTDCVMADKTSQIKPSKLVIES